MNLPKKTCLTDLVPSEFYLSQNYPNPFSEKTVIKFCVACRTRVKLQVFDTEGKMIQELLDEEKEPRTYEIEFDACNMPARLGSAKRRQNGRQGLPGGKYFFKLEAENYSSEKKMQLSR